MPRVEFHRVHGDTDVLIEHACKLCRTAIKDRFRVVMRARPDHLPQLDALLWSEPPEAFVSHETTTGGAWPVGIAALLTDGPLLHAGERALLINMDLSAPLPEQFGHVAEIFCSDPASSELARARYRTYRKQGWRLGFSELENPQS